MKHKNMQHRKEGKNMKNLNKMSKIALASAVAVSAAAVVQPASAATLDVTTDAIYDFSYDPENTGAGATITHYKGSGGIVNIPSTFTVTSPNTATLNVTEIGAYVDDTKKSFFKSSPTLPSITEIVIPSTVTKIGASAFGGRTGLGSVHIPSSVTSIGKDAFGGVKLKGLSSSAAKTFVNDTNLNTQGATFEATDYKVTYNANGGTGTPETDSNVYDLNDEATVLGKGNLSNGELVFKGWNTAADGTGTNYSPNAKIPMTASVTLYAKWGEASSRYVKPEELPFGTTGYTGYIEVLVNNDDKKTPISEALNVKITDKNNAVVKTGTLDAGKFTTDTGANTKGATVGNLAPGTYFVTLSDDQGNSQTTKATVKAAKTVVKTTWETTLDGITTTTTSTTTPPVTTKKITASGAVTGIVYDAVTSGSTATIDTNATVIIKNATTSWNVSTDAFGAFKVFVPKGKYDLVIVGEDGAKNQLYPINVVAGAAVSPIDTLSTAIVWAESDKKDFGLVVDDASLTGAIVAPATVSSKASSQFTGKALPGTTVEVYVVDDSGERLFAGEAKTGAAPKGSLDGLGIFKVKVTNPYNAKDTNVLANKKIEFVVTDAAGNSHTSEEKTVPAHAAPALAPTAAITTVVGETKLTLPKLTAAENKFVIVASPEETKNILVGKDAPTDKGNAGLAFFEQTGSLTATTLNTFLVTKDAKFADVYEVDANNKIVKFKSLTLTGKVKQ